MIAESIKPTEAVTGQVDTAPVIDLDSLLQTSVSGDAVEGDFEEAIEVVDSFTVDPKNLPEGTVIAESVKPTEAVTGEVDTAPAIDLDSLLQTSVSGEAVAGDFEESFEIIDSFTVDPKNLPEGTVIRDSVKNESAKGSRKNVSQGQPMAKSSLSKSSPVDLELNQVGKKGRAHSMVREQLIDAALSSLMFD